MSFCSIGEPATQPCHRDVRPAWLKVEVEVVNAGDRAKVWLVRRDGLWEMSGVIVSEPGELISDVMVIHTSGARNV